MKKLLCSLLLISSIGVSYAQSQSTKTESTFELPANHAQRRFTIHLDKGNKLQIELSNMEDLNRFTKMDSVINAFLQDIELLKDSLADPLTTKRIDYVADSSGTRKIRLLQYAPQGTTFLVNSKEAALLKLEQDTVNFIGSIPFVANYGFRKPVNEVRHYKVSFFLNNWNDIADYMNNSTSQKIIELQQNVNANWITTHKKGEATLGPGSSITARLPKGYVAGGTFLNIRFSVDAQNYKRYFVPSFSLGAGLILSTAHWRRELVLAWEPNFLFAENSQGSLRSYRNDFLSLTAGHGPIKDNDPRKESYFLSIVSFGYLIKRDGDFFEKGTMRFGAGRLSLFGGKTKLEPAFYFNNFFKGVTPGLRWIQSF
jgi:hypothetical protein